MTQIITDEGRRLWADSLDEFERRIEAFRAVLQPDVAPPPGLWPPPDLVGHPLPPELAERARDLLDRAREVEAELRVRRTELPSPHRAPPRHRRRPTPSSVYTVL
jgi:hypothetical protein